MEVEHCLYTLLLCIFQCSFGEFQGELALLRWLRCRELHGASSHYSTLLHHLIHEVEVAEQGEVIVIINSNGCLILLHIDILEGKLDKLMSGLHLHKLGTLVTGCRDDTIRAEVTLMRTGIIITGVEAIDTLLHLLRVVDGLVNPIPNATTDASI